jgi:SpoVK/Ycf46/Vps4 family AAA+-type ATPase
MKRIVNSLLQQIDYFPSDGILMFATNDIDVIDKALLRRMDRVFNIPIPSISSIKRFLQSRIAKYSTNL